MPVTVRMEENMSLLEAANIKKTYTTRFGGNKVEALRNVSFAVEKGEYVAVIPRRWQEM